MKPSHEAGVLELTEVGGVEGGADPISFLRRLADKVSSVQDAVGGVLFAAIDALTCEGGLPRFLT